MSEKTYTNNALCGAFADVMATLARYMKNILRSLFFNDAEADSSDSQGATSQGATSQSFIAPSSNFNHILGSQYNIDITNVHPGAITPLTGASSALPPSQPSQAPFNDAPVDNLSIHFTGRKRELALIAKAFEQRRDIPLRCALHGNQGVGKSQLTYSWAKSTFTRKENAYVMWISATTVEKLFQGLCRLLRFINHPDQSHPDQNVRLEAARRWLEDVDTGNWLLVFDNVFPETVEFLRQHLPRVNGRGAILFTTRTREVAIAVTSTAGERHEIIEIPLLNVEEAIGLFCGHFNVGKVDPSDAKVSAIVKAVGCLPLAISHAAAYMDQSRSSLDNLLELYQSKHKIDVIGWEHTLSDYEHKSVAATFTSQLQNLNQQCPDASRLLRVMAFFDPESIPLEMLTTGAKTIVEEQESLTRSAFASSLLELIQSPIACQNAITQLQAHCLVEYHATSQSPTLRIHDLIWLVVFDNTRRSRLDEESFEFAVELACAAFRKAGDPLLPEWWPQCELIVPHVQALTLHQEISSKAKIALLPANHRRGVYLFSRGRYVEAESLYQSVIAEREQLFEPDDLDTLAVMDDLAWVYKRRGWYLDAEMLFKQVLEGRKTRLGTEHRTTLKTTYHLGVVYLHQHCYNDAEALLKPTLQIQESRFGSEDNLLLWTMIVLASVYNSQRRHDEAELLLNRVLRVRQQQLGSEHLDTYTAKHALANVYFLQQHYEAAAVVFEQVLQASERDLGQQHPGTLATMYCLSLVYASQNRNAEAEKLLVRVLAGEEKAYGLSHSHTQMTAQQLLSVRENSERVDPARILKHRLSPLL